MLCDILSQFGCILKSWLGILVPSCLLGFSIVQLQTSAVHQWIWLHPTVSKADYCILLSRVRARASSKPSQGDLRMVLGSFIPDFLKVCSSLVCRGNYEPVGLSPWCATARSTGKSWSPWRLPLEKGLSSGYKLFKNKISTFFCLGVDFWCRIYNGNLHQRYCNGVILNPTDI